MYLPMIKARDQTRKKIALSFQRKHMWGQDIQNAVEAQLAKINWTPTPDPAPADPQKPAEPVTPEEPKKEEPTPEPSKQSEPAKEPEKKDEPTDGIKPVELDKKFKPVPYERFQDVNEKYKQLQKDFADYKENKSKQEPDDEETIEEKERLKKAGFVSKEELELKEFQDRENQIKQEQQLALDREVKSLEKEFDWSDWLPKFDKEKVLERWANNEVYDPRSAFIVMHLPQIIDHFVKQKIDEFKKTPIVQKPWIVQKPDLKPKDKLSLNDWTLKNHLQNVIEGMLSR